MEFVWIYNMHLHVFCLFTPVHLILVLEHLHDLLLIMPHVSMLLIYDYGLLRLLQL
jgi:hypothetical protein